MPLNSTSENATFLYFEAVIPDVWYSVADKKIFPFSRYSVSVAAFPTDAFTGSCIPHSNPDQVL